MRHSSLHRGDYKRVRASINIALIELESLEPRLQLAYKLGEFPAQAVADLSLARSMITEVDDLLRGALDRTIGGNGSHVDVYSDAEYDRRKLVGKGNEMRDHDHAPAERFVAALRALGGCRRSGLRRGVGEVGLSVGGRGARWRVGVVKHGVVLLVRRAGRRAVSCSTSRR